MVIGRRGMVVRAASAIHLVGLLLALSALQARRTGISERPLRASAAESQGGEQGMAQRSRLLLVFQVDRRNS